MRIVLLEDDAAAAGTMADWLRQAGYTVDIFTRGVACVRAIEQQAFDLCLLDWMVPDLPGIDVLARLRIRFREKMPPVIFVTGRDSDEDVASVLAAGADDYLIKPISRMVLLARINAVLRRAGAFAHIADVQSFEQLSVDHKRREILLNGQRADLTERETDLALYFFQHMGLLLTREHLIQVIWRLTPDLDTRTVDVHVSTLRRKLKLTAESGWKLVSVYRHGYRLERQEPSS